MKETMSIVASVLSLLTCVGLASRAELQGQAVNSSDRVLMLEDGTKLWLAEGLTVMQLREGVTVKLSYEERDGRHVVTSIEVAE